MINYLNNKLVLVEHEKVTKNEIIEKLAKLIAENTENVSDINLFLKKIYEREAVGTTGIGKEVVVPHARCESLKDIIIALAVLETPIEFNTPDGEKARIILLVGAPKEKNTEYLKVLSGISRSFRNTEFREAVSQVKDQEELLEVLSGLDV